MLWAPISPGAAANLFRAFRGPWWIAGGVAIELAVGHAIRAHGDLDIEILARDQTALHDVLAGWDVVVAAAGELRPWIAEVPPNGGSLWCRPAPDAPWALQVLLAESDGDDWLYRRDHRIRRPLAEVVRHAEIPYLAPEIQVLFKSNEPRPVDETDLITVLPYLDQPARRWLAGALGLVAPAHSWLALLIADTPTDSGEA